MRFLMSVRLWSVALLTGVSLTPGYGSVMLTIEQQGNDVVAWGGGTLDVAALGKPSASYLPISMWPVFGDLSVGWSGTWADGYSGVWGSANFGTGPRTDASYGTGDEFGVDGWGTLYVPNGYISNTPLWSSATWSETSLADLGLWEGLYTWYWGSGIHMDSLTLYVIPEPSQVTLMAMTGLSSLALRRWRNRSR